jgi:hypothetical protein
MININFSYKPIFKLAVNHGFYTNPVSADFELVATGESQKLTKRLGLILKEANNEYFLLCETEKLDALYAELKSDNSLKITYLLFCNNPYFLNITEVPLEIGPDFFYFSNTKVKEKEGYTLLHQDEAVNKNNRYPYKNSIEVSGDGIKKLVELKDEFGKVVFQKTVKPEERINIDNSNAPVGLYEVYVNGSLVEKIILISNVPVKRPIGVVEISLTGTIKEDLISYLEAGEVPTYDYKVFFPERSTFWKYYLIGKYNSNLKNTVIESGGSKLKFIGPEEVKLKNGKDAVMFVSETPLPIKEINDFRFQLKSVRTGLTSGKTIMDKLPLAAPDMIRPESRDENSKVFSEIIVYI